LEFKSIAFDGKKRKIGKGRGNWGREETEGNGRRTEGQREGRRGLQFTFLAKLHCFDA